METVRTILATTRVDRHGDRFTREALEGAAQQTVAAYIPMLFNHDPRIPPLGRTVRAFVEQLPDGEWALVAESEVFDTSGPLPPLATDREMVIREYPLDQITVVQDRSYRHPDDRAIIDDLVQGLPVNVEVYGKKALEPLSVLILAMSAGAAAFAGGFLNKMGSDAWDYLKPRIAKLLVRRKEDQPEYLFILEVQVCRPTGVLAIQCILTNPSQADLEQFWSDGVQKLDSLLPSMLSLPGYIRKVVITYSDGSFHGQFAVRKDCIGMQFGFHEPEEGG
jgi:hypothetical protein